MASLGEIFKSVRREDFLRFGDARYANIDAPIPIGYGQTNSQPSTVRQMLEWLDVHEGQKVLDVGSGSGWTTALLSKLVGSSGRVYAVEIVPELVRFGRENCERLGIGNAEFIEAGTDYGLPDHAPYDRILVSASASEIPESLIDQLAIGGRAVVPVGYDILVIDKTATSEYKVARYPGFIFVPLIEKR